MHKPEVSIIFITEFINNNIKTLHASHQNRILELKSDLLSHSLILTLISFILGIVLCFRDATGLAFGILLIIACLIRLFIILESITKVSIDFSNQKIFIKHLFFAPIEVNFQEVVNIDIEEIHVRRSITKYKLVAKLRGGENVILFDVPNEKDAEILKPKLLHLLK